MTRPPAERRAMIAIASDHAGLDLKKILVEELKAMRETVLDLGTNSADSVDYPDFGPSRPLERRVGTALRSP